jgi:hypothetical protein
MIGIVVDLGNETLVMRIIDIDAGERRAAQTSSGLHESILCAWFEGTS